MNQTTIPMLLTLEEQDQRHRREGMILTGLILSLGHNPISNTKYLPIPTVTQTLLSPSTST